MSKQRHELKTIGLALNISGEHAVVDEDEDGQQDADARAAE